MPLQRASRRGKVSRPKGKGRAAKSTPRRRVGKADAAESRLTKPALLVQPPKGFQVEELLAVLNLYLTTGSSEIVMREWDLTPVDFNRAISQAMVSTSTTIREILAASGVSEATIAINHGRLLASGDDKTAFQAVKLGYSILGHNVNGVKDREPQGDVVDMFTSLFKALRRRPGEAPPPAPSTVRAEPIDVTPRVIAESSEALEPMQPEPPFVEVERDCPDAPGAGA